MEHIAQSKVDRAYTEYTPSAGLLLLLNLVDFGSLPLHLTGTSQRAVNLPHVSVGWRATSERTRDGYCAGRFGPATNSLTV